MARGGRFLTLKSNRPHERGLFMVFSHQPTPSASIPQSPYGVMTLWRQQERG
jgi:hypothetical protein